MRTKPPPSSLANATTKKSKGLKKAEPSPVKESISPATAAGVAEDADAFDQAGFKARNAPARRVSNTTTAKPGSPEAELQRYFLDVQREQWQFYADNTGPSTNHLPPDNVKVEPGKPVSHRNALICFGMFAAFLLSLHWLGMLIAGAAFVFLMQEFMGPRDMKSRIVHAAIAFVSVGGMWAVFTFALRVILPEGTILRF